MATTKEKIIETSIKLFNEKGCLNTSTRHIADELGISVGNLYYHFKNKEDILSGCMLAIFILCVFIIIFIPLAMMPEQKNILTDFIE